MDHPSDHLPVQRRAARPDRTGARSRPAGGGLFHHPRRRQGGQGGYEPCAQADRRQHQGRQPEKGRAGGNAGASGGEVGGAAEADGAEEAELSPRGAGRRGRGRARA